MSTLAEILDDAHVRFVRAWTYGVVVLWVSVSLAVFSLWLLPAWLSVAIVVVMAAIFGRTCRRLRRWRRPRVRVLGGYFSPSSWVELHNSYQYEYTHGSHIRSREIGRR